ncbi:MAG TPA: hypothetical protein P5159_01405 [Phycisphaerae bacterium]|nr:hypothetical protein [Phycisphaerae bacterium]
MRIQSVLPAHFTLPVTVDEDKVNLFHTYAEQAGEFWQDRAWVPETLSPVVLPLIAAH